MKDGSLLASPMDSSKSSSLGFFRDCFEPDDFASGFNFFFKVCGHIVQGYVAF
jgi:hypothetical protein